jgi:tetratricopeptide (TPR) repeat protein
LIDHGMNRQYRPYRALIALVMTGIAEAAPFLPKTDEEVLERLPAVVGSAARELRAERDRLIREPDNLSLAVALARHYIELGQQEADPRYNGYAEGVLQPGWHLAEPPSEILLLRAALRQSRHEFAPALEDLSRLLARDPRHPEAWLMRAAILLVRADYRDALASCLPLLRFGHEFLALSCMGSVASLNGKAEAGYKLLQEALERWSQGATPGERVRLLSLLAKTAERMGDPPRAEGHFRAALALNDRDPYLLGAYADFLLDQGRPAEVKKLLEEQTRIDGLLLRLALAEQQLGSSGLPARIEALRVRFAASRMRGEALHQGDEARFTLYLLAQPKEALRLAQANFAVQREPRDLRVLLEAALAAGEREAADPALALLRETGLEDPHLQGLVSQLTTPP